MIVQRLGFLDLTLFLNLLSVNNQAYVQSYPLKNTSITSNTLRVLSNNSEHSISLSTSSEFEIKDVDKEITVYESINPLTNSTFDDFDVWI